MKSLFEKFGELIGFILYFIPISVQLIQRHELDDIIFSKVLSIVNLSQVLRNWHLLLFWGMWIIIISIGISIRVLPAKIDKKERNQWFLVISRILTGWIIANWLIFLAIDSVFYRGAIVTFPFWLGGLLLVSTLVALRYDSQLYENLEFFRTSDKIEIRSGLLRSVRIGRYLVFGILALILILPNQLPLTGIQAEPPGLPPVYGGDTTPYEVSKIRLDHTIPANISDYLVPDNDNSSWYTFVYLPRNTDKILPLTFYAHGYTGTDPRDYENSLYQLAARGNVVIFVQYATEVELSGDFAEPEEINFTRSNAMYFRYLMEWNGIVEAVNTLLSGDHPEINTVLKTSQISTDYIQIIGHSVGGGMVPYLATKTVQKGWANQQLILDMETPWYASQHPLTPYNLSIIPVNTIINIVGTQDDHLASPCLGMRHFEAFYSYLQEENMAYLIIPSDYHGFPRLLASHYVVTSTLDDTLTKWGYLKRVDAMAAYLLALANSEDSNGIRSYFLGGDELLTSQGNWSDGKPVNSLIYSVDPYGIRGGENLANKYRNAHDAGPDLCDY